MSELHNKYVITKTDGSPVDPQADYFVLRIDTDRHAQCALLAYAYSVERENPRLSKDLLDKLKSLNVKKCIACANLSDDMCSVYNSTLSMLQEFNNEECAYFVFKNSLPDV